MARLLPSWVDVTSAQRGAINAALAAADATTPATFPALAPVTVAQFILESNYGVSSMGANNYFGVKARAGDPFVTRDTTEYVGGKAVKTSAAFRRYASMQEAFSDHADLLLRRGPYQKFRAFPADPLNAARALQGVYATDPKYSAKLVELMRSHGLLDVYGFGTAASVPSPSPVTSPAAAPVFGRSGAVSPALLAALAVGCLGVAVALRWLF